MTKVSNKVIWLTGASSGIGEALAYALAGKGAKLILSARRKEQLERVKGNCPAHVQPNIRILPIDITQPDTLKLCTEAALQFYGRIDILINNAGVSQRSLAKETSIEVDRKIMDVNYFGTVELTKHLVPYFIHQQSGHLVTVSSVTGKFGTPYRSGYAASKHALHGFFDSLRAELWKDTKGKVKVTMICPGFIHTPITYSALTGNGKPLGKMDEATFKGKPATWCAKKIIRAIENNKREAYIGGIEVIAVYLQRFFPGILATYLQKGKVR
jgi:short-subunit dehydrogenase